MNRYIKGVVLFSALTLSACVKDTFQDENLEQTEGTKVRYEFTVGIDGENGGYGTKALTENAQIRNMYVAVFDDAGYKLSEYAKAELTSPAYGTGENGTNYQYSVELTVSSTPRILHFIANAPKKLTYGSESEVIGSLYTSLDNDDSNTFKESYWQRIEMDKIPAKPVKPNVSDYEGNTAGYNAALAAYNSGMTAYNNAAAKLNNIKLIRNYSKITLTKKSDLGDDKLQIQGMWMVNYPDRGTVAPYNRNTGKFMGNYLNYTSVADIEDASKGNYHGFMLATTEFVYPTEAAYFVESGASQNMIDVADGKAIGYVYEREKVLESPMYLIVKALYNNSKTCYYKVALQDNQGNFYSMLRNFNYLIEIQSVAREGEDTPYKALQGAPSGDISLNVEYNEITSISDGEATMTVSNTTLVIVGKSGTGTSKTITDLWYKYEPIISGTPVVKNDPYNDTDKVGVEITYDQHGASGEVIKTLTPATTDETGGIRKMTVVTNDISDVHKTQTIVITGKNYDSGTNTIKTITRKIDLILREYLTMDLSTGPNTDSSNKGHISKAQGEASTLTIGIETGLPSSMFPLDFKIEAARRTLTPNNDVLPVEKGISTILDDEVLDASGAKCFGRPSYWFVKSISWEEYNSATAKDGKKYFTAKFKNNVTDAETEHIYVSQAYFNQANIDLEKYTPKTLSGVSLSPSAISVGASTTYSFNLAGGIPSSGKVTVGLARLDEAPKSDVAPVYDKQLTYLRSETINEGGTDVKYDIYEMTVTDAENSIKLVAFEKGTGYIKLWADEYDTSTTTITIN